MQLNLKEKNEKLVVLMGHDKFILRGFPLTNVQLVGGWYLKGNEKKLDYLSEKIDGLGINELNFIGTSKSNTGSFIYSKALLSRFPRLNIRVFAFTPFSTIDEAFYKRNDIASRAPGTLVQLWKSDSYCEELIKRADAKWIEERQSISLYQFYPYFSDAGEVVLAERVHGSNIVNVPLPVSMHNTLFPFWNKISRDSTIETHEGNYRKIPFRDAAYYSKLQSWEGASLNLVSLVNDTDVFVRNITTFSSVYFQDWFSRPVRH